MSSTMRRFFVALFAALALLGILANVAFASLEDPPVPDLGTSKTNPSSGGDSWWRQGWGRSLYPQFSLRSPAQWDNSIDGYLIGSLYSVDGVYYPIAAFVSSASPYPIDISKPNNYYRDSFPVAEVGLPTLSGTNMDNTLDMLGILNDLDPAHRPVPLPGATSVLEGQWYYHYDFFSSARYGLLQYSIPFGIDLGAPDSVSGVTVAQGMHSAPYNPNTWTDTRRGYIHWDPRTYDKLSGVGYYQILVDGSPLVPETSTTPVQGRAYAPITPPGVTTTLTITPDNMTIESLPAGRHLLTVQAVDRATNASAEGTSSSVWYESDPDIPQISWTAPAGSIISPSQHMISVFATDMAGDPVVHIALNGPGLGSAIETTLTSPPYQFDPDLTSLPTGNYTLTATVIDQLGMQDPARADRRVTITKNVSWKASGVSGQTLDTSLDVTNTIGLSLDQSADTTDSRLDHWTNNLFPVVDLPQPGSGTDIFYNVVQTKSPLDINNLQNYDHAMLPLGTHFNHVVDLKDTIDTHPYGPWASGPVGAQNQYEGTWYFQWVWYNRNLQTVSASTYPLAFKVDLTPPAAVTGFSVSPAAGTWTSQQRARLSWNAQQYDTLSGDAEYRIYLDNAVDPQISVNATSSLSNAVTIEDMPAGDHTLSITAVDRAGNEGPRSTLHFQSDPDTPTVSLTAPAGTKMDPTSQTIQADANDNAGDPVVTLSISGGSLPAPLTRTMTAPPYVFTPNLTAAADGTYTVTAVATDHMLRTATVSKQVFWRNDAGLTTDTSVDLADGAHIGTSMTNPSAQDDADAWWRLGWGNSLRPQFSLTPPTPDPLTTGMIVGTLYDVSTAPVNIDQTNPSAYDRAARGSGTNMDQTIDLSGIFNYPPAGGWRPNPVAGATSAIEGPWYLNLIWFTSHGKSSSQTYHIPMGIDLTPPSAIESLTLSPNADPGNATNVVGTSRVHISWKPKQYDALSGVGYFQIRIDGSTAIPEGPDNPTQGRVYNIPGVSPYSVTIENLPPGMHTIGVSAVDRATNEGPVAEGTFFSDPDTPTVAIASPSGTMVGPNPTLSATAHDLGGVKSVVFQFDGQQVLKKTSAPYSDQVDLTAFASGPHILSCTVTDMLGRTVTVQKAVTLDKTPLTISGLTRNYSIFYPIKRDKYKDNLTISFSANKACTAKVVITNSAGTLVRTMTMSAAAGKNTVTWDGKWSTDNKAHTGTFTIKVTASDTAGNSATSGKVTTIIRNYEIRKLSGNRVKIISR